MIRTRTEGAVYDQGDGFLLFIGKTKYVYSDVFTDPASIREKFSELKTSSLKEGREIYKKESMKDGLANIISDMQFFDQKTIENFSELEWESYRKFTDILGTPYPIDDNWEVEVKGLVRK